MTLDLFSYKQNNDNDQKIVNAFFATPSVLIDLVRDAKELLQLEITAGQIRLVKGARVEIFFNDDMKVERIWVNSGVTCEKGAEQWHNDEVYCRHFDGNIEDWEDEDAVPDKTETILENSETGKIDDL
jgi:hypothetical protein